MSDDAVKWRRSWKMWGTPALFAALRQMRPRFLRRMGTALLVGEDEPALLYRPRREMARQGVEGNLGCRDGADARWSLWRCQDGYLARAGDELAIHPDGAPEEVDAVEGEA